MDYTSRVEGNSAEAVSSLQNLDVSVNPLGVIELPATVSQNIRSTFKWYTKVMAPNGKPIHILAQSNWTEEQVAYCRTVMESYLNNVPSLPYGYKDNVANAIANSNGAMTMFNDANSVNNNSSGVTGQDLQADETVAVGTPEYLNQTVRNAAFEEILHFVHDLGISSTLPSFQSQLEATTTHAINNRIFIPWNSLPVADYDNEHLAAFNDAYWGLVEHNTPYDHPYLFLSREAAQIGDAGAYNLVTQFLAPYFNARVLVSSTFSGTFVCSKTSSLTYTNESQYYKEVELLGGLNNGLSGNNMDNYFIGNIGDNELSGLNGNDILDGGDGALDKAKFRGLYSDYTITTTGDTTYVEDAVQNRDGMDKLVNIEQVVFSDQTITL